MVAVLILKPVVLIVRFNRGVPDPKIRIFDLGRKKVGVIHTHPHSKLIHTRPVVLARCELLPIQFGSTQLQQWMCGHLNLTLLRMCGDYLAYLHVPW